MPNPSSAESLTPRQSEILSLWRQRGQLCGALKLSRQELATLRAQLGELLCRQAAECRVAGPHFQDWLRDHAIGRSTAYRLMAAHEHPDKPPAFINMLARNCSDRTRAGEPPPPPFTFCADRLIVPLEPYEAEIARRCLQAMPPGVNPVTAVLQYLTVLARQWRN